MRTWKAPAFIFLMTSHSFPCPFHLLSTRVRSKNHLLSQGTAPSAPHNNYSTSHQLSIHQTPEFDKLVQNGNVAHHRDLLGRGYCSSPSLLSAIRIAPSRAREPPACREHSTSTGRERRQAREAPAGHHQQRSPGAATIRTCRPCWGATCLIGDSPGGPPQQLQQFQGQLLQHHDCPASGS